MAYIGNSPALKYASFAVQHFTTSATTGYTLDNAVTNENGIALFVNNVRQQPGASYAYTVSGTTLTLSAATTTSDTMYCVFIGKAVQTVNPPAGSVAASQLATDAVTTVKILDNNVTLAKLDDGTQGDILYYGASGAPARLGFGTSGDFLKTQGTGANPVWASAGGDLSFGGDTFGADKTVGANDAYAFTLETSGNPAIKMDAAGIVTKPLQPVFLATITGETRTDMDTAPTMKYANELIDKNADYNNATYTFTAPVTGSYHFSWRLGFAGLGAEGYEWYLKLYTSNFSARTPDGLFYRAFGNSNVNSGGGSAVVDMDASDVAYIVCNSYSDDTLELLAERSWFSGYLVA